MADFDHIVSRQYKVNPDKCCEKCVFGTGEHADWCEVYPTVESIREIDEILSEEDLQPVSHIDASKIEVLELQDLAMIYKGMNV